MIELEIEGFRSFQERQLITFSQSGITLISGEHITEDTGSGTGKSSIPEAIAFALGCCESPATDLKNWNSNKLYVRLKLYINEDVLDIIRSPKLKLVLNGVSVDTMSKDAEERLSQILGVPSDIVKLLTYRPQRSSDKFIDKTDSSQKNLLTSLLGLDSLEKADEDLSSQLSAIQLEHKSTVMLIDQIKALPDFDRKAATQKLTDVNLKIAEMNSKLSGLDSLKIGDLSNQIASYDTEINKIRTVISRADQAIYQNSQLKPAVEQLYKEIQSLKNHVCPTCNQQWTQNQQAIASREAKMQEYKHSYKSNVAIAQAAEPFRSSQVLEDLNARKTLAMQELASIKTPIDSIKSTLITLSQLKNQIEEEIRRGDLTSEKLSHAITKEKELSLKEHVLYHSLNVVGRQGFLGVIFDEILKEIQHRANQFMETVPNVNNLSLEISTESVTSKGKINKKISTVVWKAGKPVKKRVLSGGQQAAIELAVDLALAETVRARSGVSLGWMVLDEAMDGLDYPTKAAIIDSMRKENKGLIILVDHATEIKEMCDNSIKVQYDGQKSWVV